MSRYVSFFYVHSLVFCCISIFAFAVGVLGQGDAPVQLYQGPNATGAVQDVPVGTYRVDGKQLGSDIKDPVFSVRAAKGFRVRFCSANIEQCEEYGEGTNNLKSINFALIRVWKEGAAGGPPPVIVYEARNWAGRSQSYLPGMYRSDRNEFGKIGDNLAMSVIIGKGFRGRFCVDEGISARGAGDCEEHDEGRHNLRFADSISFIEVINLNDKGPADDSMPVVLYEDTSQGGRRQGFDVGTFVASLNQLNKVGNDRASSITIKSGYRVLICSDEFAGDVPKEKCEELSAGKHHLRQKDSASYLKVWRADK